MDKPSEDDLARLELEIQQDPTSEHARERLLFALAADPEWSNDPRRFDQIEWFLEHNPRHSLCATPLIRVDPENAPGPYEKLKSRWLVLVSKAPGDSTVVRGAAAFVAAESLEAGRQLLRAALVEKPHDAKLWLDLGRMSEDPHERLTAFEKARDAGETLSNLLVWIASTSVRAGEYIKADRAARELMELVRGCEVASGRQARLA